MANKTNLFLGIDIEINHQCNLACSYCPNSIMERKEQGQMTPKTYEKIISQLIDLQYTGRISYHFYNEPLLNPHLNYFVLLTKKELPHTFIDIFTNATLLTLEKFRHLVALGVNKFTITKHEKLKSLPVDHYLPQLSSEEKGRIKYLDYQRLHYTNRSGSLPHLGKKQKNLPLSLPCFIPHCSLVITVDGHILTCYEDFQQKQTMGNIHQNSLREIWFSAPYQKFRDDLKHGKRHKYPHCQKCNNLQIIQ